MLQVREQPEGSIPAGITVKIETEPLTGDLKRESIAVMTVDTIDLTRILADRSDVPCQPEWVLRVHHVRKKFPDILDGMTKLDHDRPATSPSSVVAFRGIDTVVGFRFG